MADAATLGAAALGALGSAGFAARVLGVAFPIAQSNPRCVFPTSNRGGDGGLVGGRANALPNMLGWLIGTAPWGALGSGSAGGSFGAPFFKGGLVASHQN